MAAVGISHPDKKGTYDGWYSVSTYYWGVDSGYAWSLHALVGSLLADLINARQRKLEKPSDFGVYELLLFWCRMSGVRFPC
jgi:hypothetical protein